MDISTIMGGLAFLITAILVAIMIGTFPNWFPTFKDWSVITIKNIFSPDFGLDPNKGYTHRQRHYGTNPTNTISPTQKHDHQWKFNKSTRHKWWVVNGVIYGNNHDIDKVIRCFEEKPGHSETKVEMVKSWKSSGAEVVHTSWNHLSCKLCSKTENREFYTAPSKKDGTPIFKVDLNRYESDTNTSKKTTTQFSIFPNKREVPVEAMKKYK